MVLIHNTQLPALTNTSSYSAPLHTFYQHYHGLYSLVFKPTSVKESSVSPVSPLWSRDIFFEYLDCFFSRYICPSLFVQRARQQGLFCAENPGNSWCDQAETGGACQEWKEYFKGLYNNTVHWANTCNTLVGRGYLYPDNKYHFTEIAAYWRGEMCKNKLNQL